LLKGFFLSDLTDFLLILPQYRWWQSTALIISRDNQAHGLKKNAIAVAPQMFLKFLTFHEGRNGFHMNSFNMLKISKL